MRLIHVGLPSVPLPLSDVIADEVCMSTRHAPQQTTNLHAGVVRLPARHVFVKGSLVIPLQDTE